MWTRIPSPAHVSYLLESYVVYQNGQRKYCKVSKVFRTNEEAATERFHIDRVDVGTWAFLSWSRAPLSGCSRRMSRCSTKRLNTIFWPRMHRLSGYC